MKKVFLIGDSIRIGYDSRVRELLQDSAQVYWSKDNARFVAYTLRYLHEWAGDDCDPAQIDVVHWNNGLWDALHLFGEEAQTPFIEYRTGLTRVVRRMKKVFPKAKIVFALTTSVIEERMGNEFYRRNAEIERYNAIAREVMAQEGADIDDLYAAARAMSDDWHAPDGTHFTEEGYQALAEAVAACVKKYL